MKINQLLKILILISIQLLFTDCTSQNELSNLSIKNKFLYVTTPDDDKNLEYTPVNSFEVFICDFDSKDIYQVTKNNSEEKNPNWYPDGSKIFYTSEYRAEDYFTYEYIYYIGLENLELKKYEPLQKSKFKNLLGKRVEEPVWSSKYKLAFVTNKKEDDVLFQYLCIYDEIKDTLYYIDKTPELYYEYDWSFDGKYILYDKAIENHLFEIGVIEIETLRKTIIYKDKFAKYHLVDWYHDEHKILFQEGNEIATNIILHCYDLPTNKFSLIEKMKNPEGMFIEFGTTEEVIFINRKDKNNKLNLWYYDLIHKTFIKYFNDGKRKFDLKFFHEYK